MRATPCLFAVSALLLLACVRQASGQAPENDSRLTFDQIFEGTSPGEWPKGLAWNHDGSLLGYFLPGEGEDAKELWGLDTATGESRRLLTAADLPAPVGKAAKKDAGTKDAETTEGEASAAGGEEEKAGLDGFDFSPAGGGLLIHSGERVLWMDLPAAGAGAEKGLRTLLSGEVESAKLSPDGQQLAFVRDADLHVRPTAKGGAEKALTTDGEENVTLNGKPDWVYWEEIWGRDPEGFWWSPDSARIAFYHFDETPVSQYPLVDFSTVYPEVKWQRYPKAGTANPKVKLGVVEVATGKTVWLETGNGAGEDAEDAYLARVHWHPDGRHVAVERLNRDQTELAVLLCDASTGACSKTLLTEEAPTWVNLSRDFRFLPDGRFLWTSERTGWRQLYLYSAEGEMIRALTEGRWIITSIDGMNEERGTVVLTGTAGPSLATARRRVYEVKIDEPGVRGITPADGWNQALVAPSGDAWVHTASSAARPPKRIVYGPDREVVTELTGGPEPDFSGEGLPTWEFQTIWNLEGNRLPAMLMKPANFDKTKKYPAIMYHYGGPGSQVVSDVWSNRGRDLWHKMMAQRGYVILAVDNLTTIFYGKEGEDKVHRDFGEYDLRAQVSGVEFLNSTGFVDPDRIGLWGWSGGGTNTLMCLLKRPGLWKAGVSGAPVTNWYLYDSIWTERYLDHPEGNEAGYQASSPLHLADQLKDHLLIVHGTGDDNVHPQNTMQMSSAFIEAGIPFEQAIYPGQKHGITGDSERHFYERMTEFFDRYLKLEVSEPES